MIHLSLALVEQKQTIAHAGQGGKRSVMTCFFTVLKGQASVRGLGKKAAGRWGGLSYSLGGRSPAWNRDGAYLYIFGLKNHGGPSSRPFEQPSDFAQLAKRLNQSEACEKKD